MRPLAGPRCASRQRRASGTTPPKSPEQLEIQAIHRIRQRLISDRTRLVNQTRGLLAEHGVVIARDISRLRRALGQIAESARADDGLTDMIRDLVREIREELAELDLRIASYNRRVRALFRSNEACQRIGQITATALVAAVGDRTCFRNGRQLAAWLGLVPRQRSSGGKARLFGISKRGDRYLRTLMIHGARAVLGKAHGKKDPRSRWIGRMRERRHPNIVAVALANNEPSCAIGASTMASARIVWSVLAGGEEYRPTQDLTAG